MSKVQSLKEYIHLIRHLREYKALFFRGGVLNEIGWMRSRKENAIVDKSGMPIPWYTYPAISFLESKNLTNLRVFEWGSGYSTIYFAKRAGSVVAVEHDSKWYSMIKKNIEKYRNINYLFRESTKEYLNAVEEQGVKYSIIVVDGVNRDGCMEKAVESLAKDGILILDDSERKEYDKMKEFLLNKGFKSLDFWGMAASICYLKCTSVFYRDRNVFDI